MTVDFVGMSRSSEVRRTFCNNVLRLFVWLFLVGSIDAFNVEWKQATQFHGNGMFGFSIAQHKEDGKNWVIIGAPEAVDEVFAGSPSTYNSGAIYYCDPSQSDSCVQVKSFKNFSLLNIRENRTRQWLGATVRSSGENGSVLVCAPRYFWFRFLNNDKVVRDPVGTCFLMPNRHEEPKEFSPCRTINNPGHSRQGSCQLGFSAAISKDSSRVYLGAVGSYYWQGQLFSIHTILKLPFTFDDHEVLFNQETGQLISVSRFNTSEMMSTGEGPYTEDDSYMGYSVESINFYGDTKNIAGVAVGVPRGANLTGKVQLLTKNMISVKNLTGEQFGSYFGYSLCVADVNGDGTEDVIVGAPMYSDYSTNKNDYEKGRIYIFYQTKDNCEVNDLACWNKKFKPPVVIDGENSKSRFGLSLTSLGDINKDGYEDFAVGAPYQGILGECMKSTVTGAVYIYHGSKNGVRSKYSQRITAEQISHESQTALTTFGFSLSGGMDMDNNLYPDLVVGAYESNSVYLFRSRPVINLSASLEFKSQTKMIELDNMGNCQLKEGSFVQCIKLVMCLAFNGIGVGTEIDLNVKLILDARKNQSRMFFKDREGISNNMEAFKLVNGAGTVCKDIVTYVPPLRPDQDKLTPLEAEMNYELWLPRYQNTLAPVLNMDDETPLKRLDSIKIKNNCGEDNICIPELHMHVQPNVEKFISGSGNLIFNVTVENRGQDSFESVFRMKIPPSVHYSKFEALSKGDLNTNVQCYLRFNDTIKCDIGNPLPQNRNVSFGIILHPNMSVEESMIVFSYGVNSSNPQVSVYTDKEKITSIPITEEMKLRIDVLSSPKDIYYNLSHYQSSKIEKDVHAGPSLEYTYTIKNLGPSAVSEATAVFYWPAKTSTGKDLLYLLQEPKTFGNIQCQTSPNDINYKHLTLTRKSSTTDDKWNSQSFGYGEQGSQSTYTQSINKNVDVYGSNSVSKGNTDKVYYGNKNYEQDKLQNNQNSYYYGSQSGQSGSTYQSGYIGGNSASQGSQTNIQLGGSYQGSQTNLQSGGSYTGSQTNFRVTDSYPEQTNFRGTSYQKSGTNYQTGNSFQIGQSASGSTYQNKGSYGGFQSLNPLESYDDQSFKALSGKNSSSFHESESSYRQNTKWNENGPITYENSSWRTNDNGVVHSGSASTIRPGYHNGNHFFEGNTNQHVNDVIAGSGGYGNSRQQINRDGSILTTIDDGIQRGNPEIRRAGNESESVYHTRSETIQFVPNGGNINTPTNSWRSSGPRMVHGSNQMHLRSNAQPINRSSQDKNVHDVDDVTNRDADVDDENEENIEDEEFGNNRRSKRQITEDFENYKEFCSANTCATVICIIEHLPKDQEVSVKFNSLVWIDTVKQIAFNRPLQLGSFVEVNVTKLPHIRSPQPNTLYSAEMLTNVTSLDYGKTPPDVIPLWVVILSACLGALILMLLIYLLYKSGFFKRNRPPALPERQPLNRNGNYNFGDEAL